MSKVIEKLSAATQSDSGYLVPSVTFVEGSNGAFGAALR
jgi:hypothetical protein